jgi:hypothetical protein
MPRTTCARQRALKRLGICLFNKQRTNNQTRQLLASTLQQAYNLFGRCLFNRWSIPTVKEVCSPVNTRVTGSKVGSIRSGDLGPGARSMPGAGDRKDSIPPQPAHGTVSRGSEPEPPLRETTKVVGPES